LDFRGPIIGSSKSPCTTSYRYAIETIALNCLVFEKIAFFAFWRQTDKQTNRQTNEQMDSIDALSKPLAVASGGLKMEPKIKFDIKILSRIFSGIM